MEHGGELHSQGEHQVYSPAHRRLCHSVDSSALLPTTTINTLLGTPSLRRAMWPCIDADTFKLICLPFPHAGGMKLAPEKHLYFSTNFVQLVKKWAHGLCYKSREPIITHILAHPWQNSILLPSLCPNSLKWLYNKRQLLFLNFQSFFIIHCLHKFSKVTKVYLKFILFTVIY